MTELYNSTIILILSLYAIVEFSRIFLKGALGLCAKFKLSQFLVGSLIVAVGTSAPELSINIFASLQSEGDIIVSNVIGSNVINISLGLGLAAVIARFSKISKDYFFVISLGGILTFFFILYTMLLSSDGNIYFSRFIGFFLIFLFFIYIYFSINYLSIEENDTDLASPNNTAVQIFLLVLGAVAMAVSADLAVKNAIVVADAAGLPKAVIGATIIAAGGSLPEIATCVRAAISGFPKIALGNVVGSQIFNLLAVLGVASAVNRFHYSFSMLADMLVLFFVTLILIIGLRLKPVRKMLGPLLIISYCFYIIYLIWVKTGIAL